MLVPSRLYAKTYPYIIKKALVAFNWLYSYSICTLIQKLQALQVGEFNRHDDLQKQNEQCHKIHVENNGKNLHFLDEKNINSQPES